MLLLFVVYMEWAGDYVRDVAKFNSFKDAMDFCYLHNWEIEDDGVWFDLNIEGGDSNE